MLKEFVKQILNEDFESFIDDYKKHPKLQAGVTADMSNPFFVLNDRNKEDWTKISDNESAMRDLKRMWNKHVDRNFIQSLTKVHFISDVSLLQIEKMRSLETFLSMSRKNEISCRGFLPNKVPDNLLNLGIVVDGRVTLAANEQNEIRSGFHGKIDTSELSRFRNSGTPRRPTQSPSATTIQHMRRDSNYEIYIFDQATFDEKLARRCQNELIVDNWKPLAVMLTASNYDRLWYGDDRITYPTKNNRIMKKFLEIVGSLPVVNELMVQWNMEKYDERLR